MKTCLKVWSSMSWTNQSYGLWIYIGICVQQDALISKSSYQLVSGIWVDCKLPQKRHALQERQVPQWRTPSNSQLLWRINQEITLEYVRIRLQDPTFIAVWKTVIEIRFILSGWVVSLFEAAEQNGIKEAKFSGTHLYMTARDVRYFGLPINHRGWTILISTT